ncbi:uncharacterized protein B0I36DRAFT_217064, partial [Microdochium trichocladiopsis]
RRRRAALTCLECRRRKIKCSREDPCAQCVAANVGCFYRTFRAPGEHSAHNTPQAIGEAELSPAQRKRVVKTPASTATTHANSVLDIVTPQGTPKDTAPAGATHSSLDTLDEEDGQPPIWPQLITRADDAESVVDPDGLQTTTHREVLVREHGTGSPQILLDKTRMPVWGHLFATAPPLRLILSCVLAATGQQADPRFERQDNGTKALVDEMSTLLRECKQTARRVKQGRPSRNPPGSQPMDLAVPTREVADEAARLYFRNFESTHRILHIPTFWAEYEHFWRTQGQGQAEDQRGASSETPPPQRRQHHRLRLKILLVIALGISLDPKLALDHQFRMRAERWVHAAQLWLAGPVEKDRLDVSGLQIHCLTLLARQIYSVGGDLVWMSAGTLLHTAMQMGLHRDPKHLVLQHKAPRSGNSTLVLRAELRRRLWATVLELVVQTSFDVALPARVTWDDFDTEPPANVDDEDLVRDGLVLDAPTKPRGKPKGVLTQTSVQLLLYASLPLRLMLLERLNGLRSELFYADILALSADLARARSHAHAQLSRFQQREGVAANHDRNPPARVTAFHQNMLSILLGRFLLHLHCSFAARARVNPIFHFSLTTTLDFAFDVIFAGDKDEGAAAFAHLLASAGGMFRETLRNAQSVVCLELLSAVRAHYLRTGHNTDRHIALLKHVVCRAREICLARIRDAGESNVKAYLFQRLTLAQAAAIEDSAS